MARPSKSSLPPHYLVTVEGTFYDKVDGTKTLKPYLYTFPVPVRVTVMVPERKFDAEKQVHFYQDVKKDMHIDDYGILRFLKSSHKIQDKNEVEAVNYAGLRTHNIINIEPSDPDIALPSNPYVLNLLQLRKFIKTNGWPVDTKLFNTLATLREAVINYKEDPNSYKVYEDKYKQRNSIRSAFSAEMEDLENFYNSPENQPKNSKDTELVDDKGTI